MGLIRYLSFTFGSVHCMLYRTGRICKSYSHTQTNAMQKKYSFLLNVKVNCLFFTSWDEVQEVYKFRWNHHPPRYEGKREERSAENVIKIKTLLNENEATPRFCNRKSRCAYVCFYS